MGPVVDRTRRALAALFIMGLLAATSAATPPRAQAGPERAPRAAAPRRLQLDSTSSRVWFDGVGTFGAFTATTSSLEGWAELPESGLGDARGEIRMHPATLKTGIGLRDRHLRQELDTDRFPLITMAVERVSASATAAGGETSVVIQGALTVKGQAHAVSFSGTAALRGDTLAVQARTPLTFTALGMKPPTRMLGTTRVRDEFTLRFEGHFLPARPTAAYAPGLHIAEGGTVASAAPCDRLGHPGS
jgi:polyisoprenoid-binding protein YceI